jgi:hypothetical protein
MLELLRLVLGGSTGVLSVDPDPRSFLKRGVGLWQMQGQLLVALGDADRVRPRLFIGVAGLGDNNLPTRLHKRQAMKIPLG